MIAKSKLIFNSTQLISTLTNSTFKLLEKTVMVHIFEALAFHSALKLHR